MIVAHATDLAPMRAPRALMGLSPPRVTYLKSPSTDLALMTPVAVHFLAQQRIVRSRPLKAILMLTLVILFAETALAIGSRAGALAAVAGALSLALFRCRPRAVLIALLSVVCTVLLSATIVVGHTLRDGFIAKAIAHLGPSAEHRRIVWVFSSELAARRPLLGHGLGTSRSIPDGQRFILLDPTQVRMGDYDGYPIQLIPLHPHNLSIEVALELGVVGLVPVATVYALVLAGIGGSRGLSARWSASVGVLTSAFVVQHVSFSAWNPALLSMTMATAALAWVAAQTLASDVAGANARAQPR